MPGLLGGRRSTYLLVTGLVPTRRIKLAAGVELLPVSAVPKPDEVLFRVEGIDIHFVALFIPWVEAQLKVSGNGSKDVAIRAWNAQWDVLLLSAIYNVPTSCALQSTTRVDRLGQRSKLNVIHHFFYDHPARQDAYEIGEPEAQWLEANFSTAQSLLVDHRFQTAVHCLATYRWHSLPRARLSLLWAGIESLFAVDSEIVFRVSLYTAKFLAPDNPQEQKTLFDSVRSLYKLRSQAVHGGKMKGEPGQSVSESSRLLSRLVRVCIERNALPDVASLAP